MPRNSYMLWCSQSTCTSHPMIYRLFLPSRYSNKVGKRYWCKRCKSTLSMMYKSTLYCIHSFIKLIRLNSRVFRVKSGRQPCLSCSKIC
ncbi:Uncharacterised protein [Vibrio cholerae]|nr:Uncharacterised protein [Vibrio cholerae]